MQNPQLSTYSVEELFTLKPALIQLNAVPIKTGYSSKIDTNLTAPELASDHPTFWGKYKWVLVGGTLVLGCICLYVYKKNKKDSSKQSN